jgi:hypothetical protein
MSPTAIELGDGPQCCDWCGAAFRNFRFASQHEAVCPVRLADWRLPG